MTADAFATVLALLALVAIVATVAALLGRTGLVPRLRPSATLALTWGFGIAATAMIGSLVFSEVFHFVPCKMCWYQRIAMYPLAIVLGIAWWRGDLAVRKYAVPLAGIGSLISIYHVLLQHFPTLEGSTTCDPNAPCTAIWVNTFGFLTIPTMALIGFVAIITLLVTAVPEELDQ